MSEQMILINRQDLEGLYDIGKSSTFKVNANSKATPIGRSKTKNNSIVKLLNIYKNKKEEN